MVRDPVPSVTGGALYFKRVSRIKNLPGRDCFGKYMSRISPKRVLDFVEDIPQMLLGRIKVEIYRVSPNLNRQAHSLCENITPCSVSLAIRQSPGTKGHLTQHLKPPRFKGQRVFHVKLNYHQPFIKKTNVFDKNHIFQRIIYKCCYHKQLINQHHIAYKI